ncbi:MAG: hypothetical protein ACM3PQ_00090, partial [Methanosarcina sp.]
RKADCGGKNDCCLITGRKINPAAHPDADCQIKSKLLHLKPPRHVSTLPELRLLRIFIACSASTSTPSCCLIVRSLAAVFA